MLEHLVEGHLGGYYISDSDPEVIEEYCEECGDCDMILTSWNPNKKNARLNTLLEYLMKDNFNTNDDIHNRVLQYNSDNQLNNVDNISLLLDEIECNSEESNDIAFILYENQSISDKEYYKIIDVLKNEEERQINMVKNYKDSMSTKDKENSKKVLKLKRK